MDLALAILLECADLVADRVRCAVDLVVEAPEQACEVQAADPVRCEAGLVEALGACVVPAADQARCAVDLVVEALEQACEVQAAVDRRVVAV